MNHQPWKRTLCCLMTAVLLFGNIPVFSFAEESEGLCPHHTTHTDQCGYAPASPGSPCTHEHTEDCYQTVTNCVHAHDGTCGYVEAVEGHGCDCVPDAAGVLTHAEGCSYVEAVEGTPCGHTCSAESGCVTRELVCPHIHDAACGYIAPTPEQPCTYVCQDCADSKAAEGVQALMDALPTLEEVKAMSMEDQAKVYNQVQSAYDAYEALTESQKALISNAESTFAPLFEYFNSLTAPAANVLDSGTCGATLTWKLTDDGVLTISGTGAMDSYSNAYSTPWYRNLSDIASIIIEDGVTKIGNYAFGQLSYREGTTVTVPKSVTEMGLLAFGGNNLQVQYAGTMAEWMSISFYYAANHWYAPGAVCSDGTILELGFCGDRTKADYPKYVLTGDGCLKIYGTGDVKAYEYLHYDSPWGNNQKIKSVVVGENITSICSYAFHECPNLTSVSLPEGISRIGTAAFRGCTALKQISLPADITFLDSSLFGSSGLESIVIPEGVRYIDRTCFEFCTALKTVTIPASVKTISNQAFNGCSALTDVYYGSNEQAWNQISISSDNDALLNARIHYTNLCAEGHTEETIPGKAATCTETGLTDGKKCSVCGEILEEQTVIPAGHTFVNGVCSKCGAITGSCGKNGDNLTYILTTDGTLTISGTGKMADYSQSSPAPWYSDRAKITSVVLTDGVTSIGYSAFFGCSSLTSVVIPDGVSFIGSWAFCSCSNLTSLTIPDGVTTIDNSLFSDCSRLTSVTIPDSVTNIFSFAFYRCSSLTSVTIPDGVSIISTNAFYGCSSLTSITIPNKVSSIESCAFEGCTGLTSVTIPDSVTSMGSSAFSGCTGLTSISISKGISSIADFTFKGCTGLTSVTIPDGVSSIGREVFYDCSKLTTVQFLGDGFTGTDDIFNSAVTAYYPHGNTSWTQEIRDSYGSYVTWVEGCTGGMTHTEVIDEAKAATCTETGLTQGSHCSVCGMVLVAQEEVPTTSHTLTKVDAKEATCTEAGVREHYHCSVCGKNYADKTGTTELTTVSIPAAHTLSPVAAQAATCTQDGVVAHYHCSVCDKNFEDETGTKVLTTVAIPAGHNFVDGVCTRCGALGGTCGENLTWVLTADGTLTISGTGAMADYEYCEDVPWFSSTAKIKHVVIESGATSIGSRAFGNCLNLTDVSIPEGVTSIGTYAFYDCSNLTGVTLPDSMTSIGEYAFKSCSKLSHINIPNGVTTIDENAFVWCESLTEVSIPASVTTIGQGAFSGCAKLEGISVDPDNPNYSSDQYGVLFNKDKSTLIHFPRPFSGEYTIPDSVTTIGCSAFCCCSLAGVTIPEGVTSIGESAFSLCPNLTSITIPEGVTQLPMYAFQECTKLTSVTIPDSVTFISYCTFSGCTELSSIIIPKNVTQVSMYAFASCSKLQTITFAGDAPSIINYAFNGITATAYYPFGNNTWTSDKLQNYGGTITWKAVCSEHSWGEWEVTTPATPEADGVETRKCAVCQQEETRPLVYSGNRLVLTGTELENQSTVWIDGVPVSVQTDDAGNSYVVLPEGASSILVTYSFNTGSGDRHTQYPTGMNVYRVETTDSGLTVTHLPELQNLLQYSGCSIRITGNKGIRMITSINKGTRSSLMGDGLAGYTLVEYGTALCRASALAGGAPLVLGGAGVKSNHAYKQGVADPIFKDTGSLIQYTNVLVGFTDEDCKEDIAMRPYIILADEKGETVTIYGGVVYRSIGYIAWQNRNAFTPGSAAYEYVWNIIRYVYGDQYDADYKG